MSKRLQKGGEAQRESSSSAKTKNGSHRTFSICIDEKDKEELSSYLRKQILEDARQIATRY